MGNTKDGVFSLILGSDENRTSEENSVPLNLHRI